MHTGQHYDKNISDIFFDILDIKDPDYNLGIGSGTHAFQTGKAMMGIEDVCFKEKPDCILVFGDTNATLAGGFLFPCTWPFWFEIFISCSSFLSVLQLKNSQNLFFRYSQRRKRDRWPWLQVWFLLPFLSDKLVS